MKSYGKKFSSKRRFSKGRKSFKSRGRGRSSQKRLNTYRMNRGGGRL